MKNMLVVSVLLGSLLPLAAQKAGSLSGTFSTVSNGITCTVELQAKGAQLTGRLQIGEDKGTITGTAQGKNATGTISDDVTGAEFGFEANLRSDNELYFLMKIPQAGMEVPFTMTRVAGTSGAGNGHAKAASPKPAAAKGNINRDLVGQWRRTETLSSGYGSNYMSLATEYFLEFREDGTVLQWTGDSAGGGADFGFSGGGGNAQQGQWYVKGNLLYFVDPATRQEAYVKYYREGNALMFTNGTGKNQVWVR